MLGDEAENATHMNPRDQHMPSVALALGGGGARAAYQAGVLQGIARRYPDLRFPFLTGVSAGAINISMLANHTGSLRAQSESLVAAWRRLRMHNVFDTRGASLLSRAMRIGMQLTTGVPPGLQTLCGMVDTDPLRQFLRGVLQTDDGYLRGVRENIERGNLESVALTALSYGTGNTVTFWQGRCQPHWERPLRQNVETPLTVEHVMASAALPLFFPPIQIDGDWYGDGGIRLVNPLAPALHTGADRILAISNHFLGEGSGQPPMNQPPSPATVMSSLYNAVFLDQLDQDVQEMQMFNKLLHELPEDRRHGLREIKLLVIRPTENIGTMAYELRDDLPTTFNFLMSRLGTKEIRSQDFLSTVMFHPIFIEQLIELGRRDGEAMSPELTAFFE